MYIKVIIGIVAFVIIVSIQLTLNQILLELRQIKKALRSRND